MIGPRAQSPTKSFLVNVREVWEQDKGPVSLQEQLVSDTLKMKMIRLHNVHVKRVSM